MTLTTSPLSLTSILLPHRNVATFLVAAFSVFAVVPDAAAQDTSQTWDPNWFYSSLAQCAAAIVGIMGSVLVFRLQSQLAIAKQNASYVDRFVELRSRIEGHIGHLSAVADRSKANAQLVRQALTARASSILLKDHYSFGGHTPSLQVQVTEETLKELEQLEPPATAIVAALRPVAKLTEIGSLKEHYDRISALSKTLSGEPARRVLIPLSKQMHMLVEPIQRHKEQTSVGMALVITIILAAMCIVSIILPLTYLSAHQDSDKNMLVGLFAACILSLPLALFFQIVELHRSARLTLPAEHLPAQS